MMHRRNTVRVLLALGVAGLAAACADQITAPSALAPSATPSRATAVSTSSTLVNALTWSKPATLASASKVIGPAGGSFSIPNGIKVTVPEGAVSSNVTFSVTRLPGSIIAYDFQPHGTTFAKPLTIEHPTAGANTSKLPKEATLEGAYVPDLSLLDQQLGTATVSEFRPTFVSATKSTVTFTVDHFSGYIVSWGRR
jgi:hypothetical protein